MYSASAVVLAAAAVSGKDAIHSAGMWNAAIDAALVIEGVAAVLAVLVFIVTLRVQRLERRSPRYRIYRRHDWIHFPLT